MKKLAIIGGAVFVLVLLAALIGPQIIDWNKYRGQAESIAENITGRDVVIEGPISARILPSPALSLANVRIANIPGASGDHLVALESLDARLALGPLLRGDIQFRRIILVGPDIELERLEDGRQNWVFETDKAENETDSGRDIGLDEFAVRNGTLVYRNRQTGSVHQIDDMDLLLRTESLDTGPYSLEGSLAYQSVPVSVSVKAGRIRNGEQVAVSAGLDFGRAAGRLTLNGNFRVDGENLSGNGNVDMNGRNADALLTKLSRLSGDDAAAAAGPLPFLARSFEATGELKADEDLIELDNVEILLGPGDKDETRLTGDVNVGLTTPTVIEARLNVSTIDAAMLISGESREPFSLRDSLASLRAPDGLNADIEIKAGAIKYNERSARQVEIALGLNNGTSEIRWLRASLPGSSDLTMQGRIAPADGDLRLVGRVNLTSNNARSFLEWIGVDVSEVPPGRLTTASLASVITGQGNMVRLSDFRASVDTSHLAGSVQHEFGRAGSTKADLSLDRIDLDAYRIEAPSDGTADSSFMAEQGALSMLNDYSGAFKLAIATLTYQGSSYGGIRLAGNLAGGVLDISEAGISDLSGAAVTLSGQARRFETYPLIDADFSVKATDSAVFLKTIGLIGDDSTWRPGSADISGTVKGDLVNLAAVTVSGSLGGTRLEMSGEIDKLKTTRPFTAVIDATSPSLATLDKQFDLGIAPISAQSDAPVTISGTMKGNRESAQLNADLGLAGGQFTVFGKVARPWEIESFAGDARFSHAQMRRFLRGMGVDFNPSRADLGAINMTARLSGTPQTVRLEQFEGAIGPVTVNGKGAIEWLEPRPKVTVDFAAGDIVVDHFMPPRQAGLEKVRRSPNTPRAVARWSNEPFEFSVYEAFDADIRLKAQRLRYGRYDFRAPSIRATFNQGSLIIDSLNGQLFGGQVSLSGALMNADEARLRLEVTMRDASLEEAGKAALDKVFATGRMNLNATVNGQGSNQLDLVQSLAGKGRIESFNGVLKGIDLDRLSQQMNELTQIQDFMRITRAALSGGETPYSEISTDINLEDGIANTENTVANITAAQSRLSATLDLPDWRVDANGTFRFADHPNVPPVGVRLSGPIDTPERQLQTGDFQSYFARKLGAALLRGLTGGNQQEEGSGTDSGGDVGSVFGVPQEQPAEEPGSWSEPGSSKVGEESSGSPAQADPAEQIMRGILESIIKKKQ